MPVPRIQVFPTFHSEKPQNSLDSSTSGPRVQPSPESHFQGATSPSQCPAGAKEGTASGVGTIPLSPSNSHTLAPKASPGFMAAGMSGLEEAQPSSSWLSWKKGTQEFGRGPRLEQRGPCAEARWEKQPLPRQDKRCFSTPFSPGIEDVVPPTPANLGKVGSSRDAHLAWSF